jgi:hypothetical protein
MSFTWDPMYVVNLVLCIIILALGCWGYRKTGDKVPLYVGIAFALFGVSHLMTLLGLKEALETVLIVVRTLAYLLVAFALYTVAVKR